MAITLDGTNGINSSGVIVAPDGSASAPSITNDGDTNTGIFFPAADTIAFAEGGVESMRIDSSGRLGIGTDSPSSNPRITIRQAVDDSDGGIFIRSADGAAGGAMSVRNDGSTVFRNGGAERARITSGGALLVGATTDNSDNAGIGLNAAGGLAYFTRNAGVSIVVNRLTDDGNMVEFRQAGVTEGTISVSGTTVSYNGGHLSRWAQMLTKPDLLKGTVMSNLDEMNEYVDADGNPVENEQLNKVKVSDVEGDANVAGVFVNWTYDEAHQVDEINMAMTGDMIIRIAQGVTVARGDLLMSAGDGTAKPQGDDIVRSKTIAKVTSTHVTCTYDDGSYCVPCVLMAC